MPSRRLPPPLFGLQRPRRVAAFKKKTADAVDGDDDRRITVPRDVRTFEFVEVFPDNYAQFIVLEDVRGRGRCWRVGAQTAASFLGAAQSSLRGADDVVFHSQRIRVFFPVVPRLMPGVARKHSDGEDYALMRDENITSSASASAAGLDDDRPYFLGRYVTIRGTATLARVLHAIETVAAQAIAWHLVEELGWRSVTYADVRRCLRDYVVCRLLCRRSGGDNRVYVRLA